MTLELDGLDRRIIAETQAGLPLCARPYDAVAARVGAPSGEVIDRLRRMLERGVIRRIGVVPNHYALGYGFNGMTVWDVDDAAASDLGPKVGALDFVSHCYLRPRHGPEWPYNFFAMVHARTRDDALGRVEAIAEVLGDAVRARDTLFSTRILKKTGLRLSA